MPVPYACRRRPFGYCGASIFMLQSGSCVLSATSAAARAPCRSGSRARESSLSSLLACSRSPNDRMTRPWCRAAARSAAAAIAIGDHAAAHRRADLGRRDEHRRGAVDPSPSSASWNQKRERAAGSPRAASRRHPMSSNTRASAARRLVRRRVDRLADRASRSGCRRPVHHDLRWAVRLRRRSAAASSASALSTSQPSLMSRVCQFTGPSTSSRRSASPASRGAAPSRTRCSSSCRCRACRR